MNVLVVNHSGQLRHCVAHHHDCWEFVIVTSGKVAIKTEFGEPLLASDSIYFVPPFVEHENFSTPGEGDSPFYTDISIQVDHLPLNPQRIHTAQGSGSDFIPFGNMLFDLYMKKDQGYSASLNSVCNAVVQLASDMMKENSIYQFPLVAEIRNYLVNNYADPITMQDLEKKFGYNGDYLRRCFKASFGSTPIEYLNDLRINFAKDLLLRMGFYTIESVSKACGYPDQFYFSKVFKKKVGISPMKFRTEHYHNPPKKA